MIRTTNFLWRGITTQKSFARLVHSQKLSEKDVEEIRIPVPWGHIAGKWWGKNEERHPIIAIHGWQDNANSFDNLIKKLNISNVLAIDLPGHGFSSHLPAGSPYVFMEYVMALRRVIKHLELEQVALLGHSLGSAVSYVYSAMYNSTIKYYISIECATTLLAILNRDLPAAYARNTDRHLYCEKQNLTKPPAYKLLDLVKLYSRASLGSVTPESSETLIKRSVVRSEDNVSEKKTKDGLRTNLDEFIKLESNKQDGDQIYSNMKTVEYMMNVNNSLDEYELSEPDEGSFVFTRDTRVKPNGYAALGPDWLYAGARFIKCPAMSIRGDAGFLYGSNVGSYEKQLSIMQKNCRYFERHDLQGSHHLHINDCQPVADAINRFLDKIDSIK